MFTVTGFLIYGPVYQRDTLLAGQGILHLQTAEQALLHPADWQSIDRARTEFHGATDAFTQILADLHSLPTTGTHIPLYGVRFHAILHLAPLAIALSSAGENACDLLNWLLFHHNGSLTASDLPHLQHSIDLIKHMATFAFSEAAQITPEQVAFDPHITAQILHLRAQQLQFKATIDNLAAAGPVVASLLGIQTSASYLLEILDSSRLQPGGGTLRNYSNLQIHGGQLQPAQFVDATSTTQPTAGSQTTPASTDLPAASLNNTELSFASSSSSSFPLAARLALRSYQEMNGNRQMQGVIAITLQLLQQVMTVIGPFTIPEYSSTVTAAHVLDLLHEHMQTDSTTPDSGESIVQKKVSFASLLLEQIFARLRTLSTVQARRVIGLVMRGLITRDVQVYFVAPAAEQLLRFMRLDGLPRTDGDGPFVVDSSLSTNSVNHLLHTTITDIVNIDAGGTAIHALTLRYAWLQPDALHSDEYSDLVHIYVRPQSQLQDEHGWERAQNSGEIDTTSGLRSWSGRFSLHYGQTTTIGLSWSVPHAVSIDSHGIHYHYLIQHQAGSAWKLNTQIILPSCANAIKISDASSTISQQTIFFHHVVDEDVEATIDYTCV